MRLLFQWLELVWFRSRNWLLNRCDLGRHQDQWGYCHSSHNYSNLKGAESAQNYKKSHQTVNDLWHYFDSAASYEQPRSPIDTDSNPFRDYWHATFWLCQALKWAELPRELQNLFDSIFVVNAMRNRRSMERPYVWLRAAKQHHLLVRLWWAVWLWWRSDWMWDA